MLIDHTINILLIEDEDFDLRRIHNTLKPFRQQIVIRDSTSNGQTALELLQTHRNRYDVVIMDFQIAGNLSGESLIRRIKESDPTLQIIVVTKMTINITDFEFANRLIEAGAMWYCTKYPGDIEEYIYQPTDFILSIINAFEKRRLEKERRRSANKLTQNVEEILQQKRLIGESDTIQQLRQQIQQCARSDTTVLIRGASGTGKELVAANIHYASERRFEKFLPINCGSLPHDLIESELFGFEKGAFTGAQEKKLGLFEVANKGSIFLDEVAELPFSAQVKLLRVIQEGEIDKIGRTEKIKVDVRIIAATNKNIEEEVQKKRFREDLYYRLNVVPIWLQSLSQRPQDIPLLVEHFLRKYSQKMGREIPEISPEAQQMLVNYNWPGNVRELQNVIQRLLFLGENQLTKHHAHKALGLQYPGSSVGEPVLDIWNPANIQPLRQVERALRQKYFQFVHHHAASDADAARLLGLAPPNYHRMCKEMGLK